MLDVVRMTSDDELQVLRAGAASAVAYAQTRAA